MIGVAAGLTGPLAPWGLEPMKMAEFAVEDIDAAGGVLGRPLEIVSADDKSDFAANGAATAIEVIDQGAVVVVTSCDFDWSAPAQAEATVARDSRDLLLCGRAAIRAKRSRRANVLGRYRDAERGVGAR